MHKLVPYYDDPSYDYPKYWEGREYENTSDRLAVTKLLRLVPKGGEIVDIGGGFGRLIPAYQKHFSKLTLVDSSEKMLSQAKKMFGQNNLTLVRAFAEKLPFTDKSFDAALMVRTYHHLADNQKAINEVGRIVKPGGYFILEFANKLHFKTRLKSFLKLDFNRLNSLEPITVGKTGSDKIPFLNHHPEAVKGILKNSGFILKKVISVSNFRSPFLKRHLPLSFLLATEKAAQNMPFNLYTGPSIFILSQKTP